MRRSSTTVVIALALLLLGCTGTPEATNGTDTTTTSSTSTSTTTFLPVEVPLAIWSGDSPEADTPESAAAAAVRALHGITPVLAAISAGAVIDTPVAGSTHPAGILVVEGSARGFEAAVIAVMVRGGVGLAEDPGEFSAVAIRVTAG